MYIKINLVSFSHFKKTTHILPSHFVHPIMYISILKALKCSGLYYVNAG